MATLQKLKPKPKPKRASSETITEDSYRPNDEQVATTATLTGDTNELEQLMLEPVSYDHLCTTTTSKQDELSPELVQSLQSIKQVSLVALDSLLRQMVNTIPSTKFERRLSDSSVHEQSGHYSLLNSIVQSTNCLSSAPSQPHQMKRSDSTPAVATLSIVQQVLTSHQTWLLDSSTDYNMCCSLAALLHHLYRILELGQLSESSSTDENDDINNEHLQPISPISPTSSIYSQLRESMSTFQKEKAIGSKMINTSKGQQDDSEDEMTILWDELDQLMNSITCLAQERPSVESAPPAYSDIVTPSLGTSSAAATLDIKSLPEKKDVTPSSNTPPGYSHRQNEKAAYDLDQLLSAIDQLSTVSPRLNNQRVDMTERQAKELAAATVGRTIERLSRGRLEEQRASLSTDYTKIEMLQGLMNQIQRSSLRTLDNQRVSMNSRLKKKMNAATINGILDRNDRGRLASQDWTSPEQQMIDDMTTMTDMLTKVMNRPKYNQQRYSLSALKEREFFFNHLLQKVDRMEGRRMSNQDAEWTHTKAKSSKSDMEDELGYLFDNIHRSKSQLDNQRATFSTSPLILSTAST
ncbi:hypothetical protein BCR42DRAFT_427414 [Absidia repens]|uniref:Uncharacterized protein n=1 Tax=Absidia repens TaxID=90262 RepID=A0A1X2HZ92_9FUNG|nr:hypothetical protein BCR42DRAFT_427414 [Absidia repens]